MFRCPHYFGPGYKIKIDFASGERERVESRKKHTEVNCQKSILKSNRINDKIKLSTSIKLFPQKILKLGRFLVIFQQILDQSISVQ